MSRRVLCNIRSRCGDGGAGVEGGRRCFLAFYPFSPSDGSRSSSEHDRFITATHARNLGHDVRVNYSTLHNGVNQVRGQTYIRQDEVTAVSSLRRRRTESEIQRRELTTLSIGSDWTFTATNLNILYKYEI